MADMSRMSQTYQGRGLYLAQIDGPASDGLLRFLPGGVKPRAHSKVEVVVS